MNNSSTEVYLSLLHLPLLPLSTGRFLCNFLCIPVQTGFSLTSYYLTAGVSIHEQFYSRRFNTLWEFRYKYEIRENMIKYSMTLIISLRSYNILGVLFLQERCCNDAMRLSYQFHTQNQVALMQIRLLSSSWIFKFWHKWNERSSFTFDSGATNQA